jgi:predicted  nucleic acid-binding Zn-ribbon protein
MTDEDHLLLKELKANVQRLFQEYQNLKNANGSLRNSVAALQHEIARLESEKNEMSRQNEKIKLANRILAAEDENGEAKRKINSLVREIDKCIALLNK